MAMDFQANYGWSAFRNPRTPHHPGGGGGGPRGGGRHGGGHTPGTNPNPHQPPPPTGSAEDPGAPPVADPFNQSAFDAMMLLLNEYGLGELADTLKGLIQSGVTDSASIQLALQQTDAWKRRFAGNELLKQAGLPVLSVAEYLATERSYAQVMKNYGLPKGFYDDPSDFAKWIGNSVSANELQQRAQIFSDISKREDPAITDQLKSMGLTDGDILAYAMDPTRAMPLLQQKYQTTLIGAAARRAGVVGDNTYLSHLADIGVSEQQAAQGYGTVAENAGTLTNLAGVYGENYTQHDLETEVFEQNGDATKKRKRLASQERANFSGSSGIGQGSLIQHTSGSY